MANSPCGPVGVWVPPEELDAQMPPPGGTADTPILEKTPTSYLGLEAMAKF